MGNTQKKWLIIIVGLAVVVNLTFGYIYILKKKTDIPKTVVSSEETGKKENLAINKIEEKIEETKAKTNQENNKVSSENKTEAQPQTKGQDQSQPKPNPPAQDKPKNGKYNVGKLFSIKDKIDCRNNFFEYKGLYIDEYNPDYEDRIIYMYSMENITDKTQIMNIHIKFYDADKKCIRDYQHDSGNTTYDDISFYTVKPHEATNRSYTVYGENIYGENAMLIEGKTLGDAKYFSIEDIVRE
ncbi:MAG: hypothetical protein ACM3UU_06770 [Ignavibacteriales bacterium]